MNFVGVYDSGLGGLSVLKAIHQALPDEPLRYFADSAYAPYGDRGHSWIEQRVHLVVDAMVSQGAKAIVLACNTATAIAVDSLRQRYDLPIIAIEPGIKIAVAGTRSGVIGVIGTTGTLSSKRYLQLQRRLEGQVNILTRATPGLVEYIERYDLESNGLHQLLVQYLQPLMEQGADHLVLGCTHYPFIEQQIRRIVGEQVILVNPASAVAQQLHRQLLRQEQLHITGPSASIQIMTSGNIDITRQFLQHSLNWQMLPIHWPLPMSDISSENRIISSVV